MLTSTTATLSSVDPQTRVWSPLTCAQAGWPVLARGMLSVIRGRSRQITDETHDHE